MTPDQFRVALADLRLSQVGFARLALVDARTVRRWCDGTRAVPGPVVALLGMMAHYKQALETAMLTDGGKPIDPQGIGVHILEGEQP
jgi:hypothetical protein